jgi:hypothetical protein
MCCLTLYPKRGIPTTVITLTEGEGLATDTGSFLSGSSNALRTLQGIRRSCLSPMPLEGSSFPDAPTCCPVSKAFPRLSSRPVVRHSVSTGRVSILHVCSSVFAFLRQLLQLHAAQHKRELQDWKQCQTCTATNNSHEAEACQVKTVCPNTLKHNTVILSKITHATGISCQQTIRAKGCRCFSVATGCK